MPGSRPHWQRIVLAAPALLLLMGYWSVIEGTWSDRICHAAGGPSVQRPADGVSAGSSMSYLS